MATHSSIPAWEIPRTQEPGGLQSTGSQGSDATEATKPPPPSEICSVLLFSKYAFIMAWAASWAFLILRFVCFVSGRSGRRWASVSCSRPRPSLRPCLASCLVYQHTPAPCPRPTHPFPTAAPWSCTDCVMCTPELGSRPSHLPGEGPRGEVPWNGPGGGLSQEFGSPKYTRGGSGSGFLLWLWKGSHLDAF